MLVRKERVLPLRLPRACFPPFRPRKKLIRPTEDPRYGQAENLRRTCTNSKIRRINMDPSPEQLTNWRIRSTNRSTRTWVRVGEPEGVQIRLMSTCVVCPLTRCTGKQGKRPNLPRMSRHGQSCKNSLGSIAGSNALRLILPRYLSFLSGRYLLQPQYTCTFGKRRPTSRQALRMPASSFLGKARRATTYGWLSIDSSTKCIQILVSL